MCLIPERDYWDAVHKTVALPQRPRTSPGFFRGWLRRRLGKERIEALRSYNGYMLWNILYPSLLPRAKGLKVLEVGSAPGYHLLQFAERFGYEPYGVEYSQTGVALNRRLFQLHGIPADHVLACDFFSEDFLRGYAGRFDVVVSNGFVEHFPDPGRVVARHVELLAPGGSLVLSIPHLEGMNYRLALFFNRAAVAVHNLEIMKLERFLALFSDLPLCARYCDYFGVFDFGLFNTPPADPRRFLLTCGMRIQRLLNLAYYAKYGRRVIRSPRWSPYLLYIGTRSIGMEPCEPVPAFKP